MSLPPFYESMTKKELHERWIYFEKKVTEYQKEGDRYRKLLSEAHALIGRIIHQLSKRWDSAPLTEYMEGLLK